MIPSLFTYIELKVPSGSFFGKIVFTSRTTRANPVLKSSIANRSDEGLTLETSASESLYGGQFTLRSNSLRSNERKVFTT